MRWLQKLANSVETNPWPWLLAAWLEGALVGGIVLWWVL